MATGQEMMAFLKTGHKAHIQMMWRVSFIQSLFQRRHRAQSSSFSKLMVQSPNTIALFFKLTSDELLITDRSTGNPWIYLTSISSDEDNPSLCSSASIFLNLCLCDDSHIGENLLYMYLLSPGSALSTSTSSWLFLEQVFSSPSSKTLLQKTWPFKSGSYSYSSCGIKKSYPQ